MRVPFFVPIALLALVCSISGCSTFRNENSWYKPPNIVTHNAIAQQHGVLAGVKSPDENYAVFQVFKSENVTQINPWTYAVPIDDETLVLYAEVLQIAHSKNALTEQEERLAKMYRNMLQDAIIGVSNTVGSAHVASIMGVEDATNLVTGALDIGFDGASVIATGTGSKTIFAALSAFFGSSRSLINEEIYNNILAPAIVQAILKERLSAWKDILDQRDKSIYEYNVEHAIADAIAYHESWSFYRGLQSLVKAGQVRVQSETESIQKQVDERLGTKTVTPTEKIAAVIREIDKIPDLATRNKVYTQAASSLADLNIKLDGHADGGVGDKDKFISAVLKRTGPGDLEIIARKLEQAQQLLSK